MRTVLAVMIIGILAGCGEVAAPVDDVCVPAPECVPSCPAGWCGDDGCGCPCPACDDGYKCRDDQCVCAVCGGECGACPELDYVPVAAGTFTMGCVADAANVDKLCSNDELPPHAVTLPGFEAGEFEVTVSQYAECVAAGACLPAGVDSGCNGSKTNIPDNPINCVTWDDAVDYCMWAGARLGSESEWEYAARGTDGRKYPWGAQGPTCTVAWTAVDNCAQPYTRDVGSFPAGQSPFGCMDMAGNVSEWVADPWHASYSGAPTDGSVWEMDDPGSARVHRGGGYNARIEESRVYNRMSSTRGSRSKYLGFRCFR